MAPEDTAAADNATSSSATATAAAESPAPLPTETAQPETPAPAPPQASVKAFARPGVGARVRYDNRDLEVQGTSWSHTDGDFVSFDRVKWVPLAEVEFTPPADEEAE